jgi:hypothetical protein
LQLSSKCDAEKYCECKAVECVYANNYNSTEKIIINADFNLSTIAIEMISARSLTCNGNAIKKYLLE